MANVIEYVVKLNDQMSGKLAKVNAGLSDMQSKVSGGLRNLGGPFDDIANKLDGIPIGLAAVGAGAGGLAAVGKFAIDAANNVQQLALAYDKLAQKTGASVEFLSGFTEAADDVGITSESVNNALIKFSDNLFALRGPSANVQAELMALADQFARMPDGPTKTAMAIDAFGRAGAEMIPILNQGSGAIQEMMASAQAMGLTVDASMVETAKRARDAQDQLNDSLTGFTNRIGANVLPHLASFVEHLNASGEATDLQNKKMAAVSETHGQAAAVIALLTGRLDTYSEAAALQAKATQSAAAASARAGQAAAQAGQGFVTGGNLAVAGANRFYLAMNIVGQAAQAPVQYQRTLQTNANRMQSLLKDQARDAENSVKAYGARYTQQAVEMGRAIGASSANFELFSRAVGGAGAAVKELTADQQALIDRTNALKGALSQSIKPMDAGEQLQTAYAIATGEVSVAQFEQEQAVKALLTAMEQQKLTNDQVLTTVLGMREGVLSSNDAFEAAGEAGAAARDEYNKVVSSADIATKRIADLSTELKRVPKDSKVNVSAVISGLRDVQEMRSEVESIRDRNVTVTVTTRYVTSGTPPPGDPGAPGGGTGGTGNGSGNEGGGRTSFVVNTPVTVKETNPRNAAAYVARMQRHTARQAALRASAGFMG